MGGLSREAQLGLFTLVGLALVFWATFQLGNLRIGLERQTSWTVDVSDAHGLGEDSKVELAGIRVGQVREIIVNPETMQARMTIGLRQDLPLYADARIWVRTSGLLGDRYLEVVPGSPEAGRLEPGAHLGDAGTPPNLEQMMDDIGPVVENIEAITADIRGMTGDADIQTDLRETLAALRGFTVKLDRVMGSREADLSAVIADLAVITRNLREDLPRLVQRAEGALGGAEGMIDDMREPVTSAVARIDALTVKLDRAAEDLALIIGDVRDGKGIAGQLLAEDSELGREVAEVTRTLGETIERVNRMRTIVDYLGQYQLAGKGDLGGGFRHRAELRIQPSWDHYYSFGIVDRPEGRTTLVEREVRHLNAAGAVTLTERSQEIEVEDVFLFNAQLARRFWDITLRGGILENSGGIGLDWALFDDRLWLRTEAFEFLREGDRPYLRGWAEVRLWKHLTISAGVEDVVGRRIGWRPAFGAGLTFDDEDLKLLFSALPSVSF
jgi:phospholipid/cholesterol/gamma-HCH transport system substrate-binding protein